MPMTLMIETPFDAISGLKLEHLKDRKRPGLHVIRLSSGKQRYTLNVLSRSRAPYPSELRQLSIQRDELARTGLAALRVPYMPESIGNLCAENGWSWFDGVGNFHVEAPGLFLDRRVVAKRVPRAAKKLPSGRASLIALRWLVMASPKTIFGATQLAAILGVTQPRASQLLAALTDLGLVHRVGARGWSSLPQACLDAFLESYEGPRGRNHYFFTPFGPLDISQSMSRSYPDCAVSADVGVDLLAPARRPSHVVIYIRDFENKKVRGWSRAKGPHDANVIVCDPEDETLFWDAPPVEVGDDKLSLAHPTQMLWDMKRFGEGDRNEAVEVMKAWIFEHPATPSP